MVECSPKALAARVVAKGDDYVGADNGQAVEDAFSPEDAIHYAIHASKLADDRGQLYASLGISKKPAAPGKEFFKSEKVWAKFGNSAAKLSIGHPDWDVFPHEILGDEIVNPVKEAHKAFMAEFQKLKDSEAYKNRKKDPEAWKETLQDTMAESGYSDARSEARELIEDKFGDDQDVERFKYANAWLNRYVPDKNVLQKGLDYFTNNFVENAVKFNPLLIYRHFFDQMRVMDQYGFSGYAQGVQEFKAAIKSKSPEISQINPRQDLLYPHEGGFDPLHKIASWNQGVTYYAAKSAAMKEGMGVLDAKAYAKAAVEHLQFQTSPVDQPRAFWNNGSLLALSKYHLLERRWYLGMWQNLAKGWQGRKTPEGRKLFQNARRQLFYYVAGHALVFGASSDLPAEVADPLEALFPGIAADLKRIDRFSLSGAANLDMAKYTRNSLTLVGLLPRLGLLFNVINKESDNIKALINHPGSVKSLVKVVSGGIMGLPSGFGIKGLSMVGNGNIRNFSELMFRVFANDYNHTTVHGKKYTTTPFEEFSDYLRGGHESLDRNIQKADLDSGRQAASF